MIEPNFLEIIETEEANKVDLKIYSCINFSNSRNAYIFKKRKGR